MPVSRRISLTPGALVVLAGMILILPLEWTAAVLLAGGFHELCHALAVGVCGGEVLRVCFGAGGARMETSPLSRGRELACALAGPLGGLCLLLFARAFPRLALCAGLQSIYNLLPVYPLDGGRALRCAAGICLPPATSERFCRLAQTGCLTGLAALGIFGAVRLGLGLFPILAAAVLVFRAWKENRACNVAAGGVK